MAKKSDMAEAAVSPAVSPTLLESAIEHMALAAEMLRSKGGRHAEACAYIAAELDRWREKVEGMNEQK